MSCQSNSPQNTAADTAHMSQNALTPKRSAAERPSKTDSKHQNGDIIFQTSLSEQSLAIQLVTESPYSHVGIIYEEKGKWFVYEAVSTVRRTSLDSWIKRGKKQHYVVKRLKNTELLTPANLKKMKKVSQKYQGKHYDLKFEWSDNKIYCSELVWKIYDEALGISLGGLQQFKEFNLSNPIVQEKIEERYGKMLPMEQKVISPARIFDSNLLETVFESPKS